MYVRPAVEAKNTFSYIVMQVIWSLKFCDMTKSGGTICISIPRSKFWGDLSLPSPPWSTPMGNQVHTRDKQKKTFTYACAEQFQVDVETLFQISST